jgi:hypothetical protein
MTSPESGSGNASWRNHRANPGQSCRQYGALQRSQPSYDGRSVQNSVSSSASSRVALDGTPDRWADENETLDPIRQTRGQKRGDVRAAGPRNDRGAGEVRISHGCNRVRQVVFQPIPGRWSVAPSRPPRVERNNTKLSREITNEGSRHPRVHEVPSGDDEHRGVAMAERVPSDDDARHVDEPGVVGIWEPQRRHSLRSLVCSLDTTQMPMPSAQSIQNRSTRLRREWTLYWPNRHASAPESRRRRARDPAGGRRPASPAERGEIVEPSGRAADRAGLPDSRLSG